MSQRQRPPWASTAARRGRGVVFGEAVTDRIRELLAERRRAAAARELLREEASSSPASAPARSLEALFLEEGGEWTTANTRAWKALWRDKPTHVGIDAEGTHLQPPLLVQIAWGRNSVLLDAPRGSLSRNLRRLLADETIEKIFFGPPKNENFGDRVTLKSCVDLQELLTDTRGKLPSLATAAGNTLLGEPLAKNHTLRRHFSRIRKRPTSLDWLDDDIRLYSAADAWVTLRLYDAVIDASKARRRLAPIVDVLARSW